MHSHVPLDAHHPTPPPILLQTSICKSAVVGLVTLLKSLLQLDHLIYACAKKQSDTRKTDANVEKEGDSACYCREGG